MSKIIDDVKSGLKGIRGTGDALRGGMMEATDQAFEKNPRHPAVQESHSENRAVFEKGKQDMRGADEMFARHEWKHKAANEAGQREAAAHGAAPTPSHTTSTNQYGSEATGTGVHVPNQTARQNDTYAIGETLTREPGAHIPGDQR
ncbi:hypothetical protein B0J13DRAFT_624749 [Dactylonectria estremocensis]|uniref:Uncharacterized protein n=1 Tax=Dactylonectria estremocensis TaxID=1079267 RepID=A0A9P9J3H5_9HYPO|nr:hypothetical protein B0J13DRAFT_624749 [Dactylonectria estremocensis]